VAKASAAATPAYERARCCGAPPLAGGSRGPDRRSDVARDRQGDQGRPCQIIRSQDTLSLSAEEAVRNRGRAHPLDASAMGAGKICFMLRFPVGVVAGITPFKRAGHLACHRSRRRSPPATPWC